MKTLKEYMEQVADERNITDDWFKTDSFKTFKLAKPISYETARDSGTVDTLEGPVRYERGHKIITGPKGEKYPVSPDSFYDKYDDNGDGTATPKKIIKFAKLADHSGSVDTSWGEKLHYNPGEDVIVRHGENDYGVVKKDIFAQTYEKM
jgi:hypothetical protein